MSHITGVDSFLSLTPDRVLEAVEASGLACRASCHPLNSFENRVYAVTLEDGRQIVAKFYRPGRWTREQILEEHRFLEDLVLAEVPVSPVLPFPDGTTLRAIEGIWYCLHARLPGRTPQEIDAAEAERLGMVVARIHLIGALREAPTRLRIEAEALVRAELRWLDGAGIVADAYAARFLDAGLAVAAVLDRRLHGVEMHRIHGDFHLGNLVSSEGAFSVLDFDDMVMGPAVQDLWLIAPGRDPYYRRLREAFLEGYEQFRAFDRTSLELIEPLRGLRMIRYAAWLARRWHDPLFQATWPHFGTQDYWRDETEALEEVVRSVARLEEGGNGGVPVVEDPPLTNRELFWDWDDAQGTVPVDKEPASGNTSP